MSNPEEIIHEFTQSQIHSLLENVKKGIKKQTLNSLKRKVNNMHSVVDHPQRVKTIDEFIKLIEKETDD